MVHGTDAPKVLADTGHGYLQHLPLALIVCLITLLSFVAADAVWSALTRRPVTKLPVWPFLLTGPVTFTVQEHVERYQATGQLPWSVTLEATFLVGLLLQGRTALLIYFMARQVMSTARHAIAKVVDRCRRPGDYPKSEPGVGSSLRRRSGSARLLPAECFAAPTPAAPRPLLALAS